MKEWRQLAIPLFRKDGRKDWETPPEVFRSLDAEFAFTLDVCATPTNAKCQRFFTVEDDGLIQRWSGVCWCNPPYGKEIGKWLAKALEETRAGHCDVVCLVPSRTDTAWWHDTIEGKANEVRFIRGRLRFVGNKSYAPFPSAVVIYRRNDSKAVKP